MRYLMYNTPPPKAKIGQRRLCPRRSCGEHSGSRGSACRSPLWNEYQPTLYQKFYFYFHLKGGLPQVCVSVRNCALLCTPRNSPKRELRVISELICFEILSGV